MGTDSGRDAVRRIAIAVLTVRLPRKRAFLPNLASDTAVQAGSTLIVFGSPEQVGTLREAATPWG